MLILLTGFEPFGGRTRNPSDEIARALDGEVVHAVTIVSRVLPVDTRTAPARLSEAIASVRPAAVVCLGEAARRQRISLERLAVMRDGVRLLLATLAERLTANVQAASLASMAVG